MAGAGAQWTATTLWDTVFFLTGRKAMPRKNNHVLISTASAFQVRCRSSNACNRAPTGEGFLAASLASIPSISAAALCQKATTFRGGTASPDVPFLSQRLSPRPRVHESIFSEFLPCASTLKHRTSVLSRSFRTVNNIPRCNIATLSGLRDSTAVPQTSSACSSNPHHVIRKTTRETANTAAPNSNSSSYTGASGCCTRICAEDAHRRGNSYRTKDNILGDVSGCRSDCESSRCLGVERGCINSSCYFSSCGARSARSSSSSNGDMLRLRKNTRALLLDDRKKYRVSFSVCPSSLTSLFSSSGVRSRNSVSGRYPRGARLQHITSSACSSLRLLKSLNRAAAVPPPAIHTYPFFSGAIHSHFDGASVAATCFAHPGRLLRAHGAKEEHDNDWNEWSSTEGGSSMAWAKAAAALTAAAAAAAAAVADGDKDYQVTRGHRRASANPSGAWYNQLSCASSQMFSAPSARFTRRSGLRQVHPVSAVTSLSPPTSVSRASLFYRQRRRSNSSVSASSPSGAVRRVVSYGRSALARCCGIVGYVGDKEAQALLLGGLEILQNRGYDSCGISSVPANGGALVTTKYASRGSTCDSLEILKKEAQSLHAGNCVGIGHTRWATHGSKTDANAHPHHDWRDRVSVVHNGTIDNFSALKQALLRRGCKFRSETDSEVIANLIGWHLDNGAGFEEAVKNAVGEIQGTWGLCILHKDYPDRLILARNGSPLLVGASSGQVFVASEPAALAQHTNQYLMLKDGEIAVITAEGIGQLEATRPVHFIGKEDKVELSPAPFPHWTVKEIYEQPQALARAMNYGGRIAPYRSAVKLGGLDQSRESLLAIKNLLICGCGTSLYAGLYGELLMQWLGCLHQVRAVDASELELHAFPKDDAGILLLSQSGETLDTVRACQLAEIYGIKKFSIVNQVGSLLARLTDCGVYVNAGREVGVASTKAFSCQVTVLSLIAAWFFQNKSEHPASQQHSDRCALLMDAIQRLPVYAGMTLNCRDACASVAAKLADAKTIFVLGKGFGFPVALEGALKIKEVGCIHAEGFAAGALKHGPFALIDEAEHTPVIMLVLGDHHAAYMLNAAQQVKARGARLVCVTDVPEAVKGIADDVLVVPSNGPLTALLACIPLQLLAYEIAVLKGINPDKPRGLAKTVTVF